MTGPACAVEAAETQPAETVQESTSGGWTKGKKIAGFLVLFTIACGGTAYLVMRPSLKKLKETKQQTQETETQSDAQSESPEKTSS
ncbi:MAG: hypothetical protein LUC50_04245 [Ruminococcus sp.]|nr:hypothetical protein [Ruminococcus sp.]